MAQTSADNTMSRENLPSGVVALTLDDSFSGLDGFAKMPLVAKDFPFGHMLPTTTFPADFVRLYAAISKESIAAWLSGFYAIGSAYGHIDEMRMMINLDPAAPESGKIYVWSLAHDALGAGDNTRGLARVADNLEAFFADLQPEDAL